MGNLGTDIKARRQSLGLNQHDLAELSGTSERFIRDLEHGKSSVRLDKLTAVLSVLGLQLRAEARTHE